MTARSRTPDELAAGRAFLLSCQAHEELGGIRQWPAQTDGDRQRAEHVRQALTSADNLVLAALTVAAARPSQTSNGQEKQATVPKRRDDG